jgi:hypothetical protein
MLTKEDYNIKREIFNTKNYGMYEENKFSKLTHNLIELSKKGKIDQREFNVLITYSSARLVEKEIKSIIDRYMNNNFPKYLRRLLLNGTKR